MAIIIIIIINSYYFLSITFLLISILENIIMYLKVICKPQCTTKILVISNANVISIIF